MVDLGQPGHVDRGTPITFSDPRPDGERFVGSFSDVEELAEVFTVLGITGSQFHGPAIERLGLFRKVVLAMQIGNL